MTQPAGGRLMRPAAATARRYLVLAAGVAVLGAAAVSCGGDGGPTGPGSGSGGEPNPAPSLASLSPAAVRVGTRSLQLTLEGSDFVRSSIVRWNGADRPTTFVSSTRLTADVGDADLATAGPASVTVVSPTPGGGTTEPRAFLVQYPSPALDAIAPTSAAVGSAPVTLTVTGRDFVPTSVVRWNGFDRPTTYVSATELTAAISQSDLAIAAVRDVTVFTPNADGGPSSPVGFSVLNPTPVASAIAPTSVNAYSPQFTLTVTGSSFTLASVVRVNGADRPTTFVSATELRATVLTSDITTPGGNVPIVVYTHGPGGGSSASLPLAVLNPTPVISAISPASAPAGSAGLTIEVAGDHFVPGAVVRWNGADRPTTFASATSLTVAIAAADVASRGSAPVTVQNPAPGGGTSGSRTFVVVASDIAISSQLVIDLPTRDIIADPVRQRLYVSVPGSSAEHANTVTAIDPVSGAILFSVPVGSEPGRMAVADDGSYLYVALGGEPAVRRVDLAAQAADIEFKLGDSYWGPMYAGDMVVLPGAPHSVAIARLRPQLSPSHGGVAIYDDGVMRPTVTSDDSESGDLEPSGSPSTLYGFNDESTEFGLRRLSVTSSGVAVAAVRTGVLDGYPLPTDMTYDDGRLYATNGTVVDAASLTRIGAVADTGLVRPDAANGRVLFLNGTRLAAYHYTEFTRLGAVTAPTTGNGHLVRWGTDGVAYRNATQVVILRTNLVGP